MGSLVLGQSSVRTLTTPSTTSKPKVIDLTPSKSKKTKKKEEKTSIIKKISNILSGKDINIGNSVIKTGLGERDDVIAGTVPLGIGGSAAAAQSSRWRRRPCTPRSPR